MTPEEYVRPEEMDGDEVFAAIAGLVVALVGLFRWYLPVMSVTRLNARPGSRVGLQITPPACVVALLPVLFRFAAIEVREDFRYIVLFLFVGGAWLTLSHGMVALLGISVRDDAVENANVSAEAAACGGLAGGMACFAWGNVGEGPTIWTTIVPALLATAAVFGVALVVELTARPSEAITIDRDPASGFRHAGFLVAAGLIFGRASAGNWVSLPDTVKDLMAGGWPAAMLAMAAIVVHRALQPTPRAPRRSVLECGLAPGGLYVAGALLWITLLGPW